MKECCKVAWAAGFYEGEGCIGRNRNSLHLQIGQANDEPLLKFLDVVGVGRTYGPYDYGHEPIYAYHVYGDKAKAVIDKLMEHLSRKKREQATRALAGGK